jgi:hypothetical protein
MRRIVLLVSLLAVPGGAPQPGAPDGGQLAAVAGPAVFGVFAGSTPCDDSIRRALRIAMTADADLLEWTLVLHKDPNSGVPADYRLQFRYGLTVPNKPGLGDKVTSAERTGSWRIVKGTPESSGPEVYELAGAVSLRAISGTVLHAMNPDGSLMIGNGGWSYTLNRTDASETRVDPFTAPPEPAEPRSVSPLSTGPAVFAVFEGRTPCQGIARELNIRVGAGCAKAKWRVTLFQHPQTRQPTTYKIEGTLHRSAREGSWRIDRGRGGDPTAIVYRLAPTGSERGLQLLKGDDHVVFLLDQQGRTLAGHAEFSYTLDRRRR